MALVLQGAANASVAPVFSQFPVPELVGGRSIAVTTSSQAIPIIVGANTLIITNTSNQVVYCKFGTSTVTVNTGDLGWQFIVAGTDRRAVGVPSGTTHIAFIGSAACNIYVEQY